MELAKEKWDLEIRAKDKWYQQDFAMLWRYRDLLLLLVRRDFVAQYKQTILGPLWLIIQPIITTLIYTVIFGYVARIGTDQIPRLLFYLSGLTLWAYFTDCITKNSATFLANSSIFGKVYFPRLIVPLSVLVSNLIKLGIQILLFLSVWLYYLLATDTIHPQYPYMAFFPILVLITACFGFSIGILISSLTTKYRDLTFLVGFGIQLLMYVTPIVYPMSAIPGKYKIIVYLNPMSSIIECFKYMFLGIGNWDWLALSYSAIVMAVLLFISLILFKRVEKTFMDTV